MDTFLGSHSSGLNEPSKSPENCLPKTPSFAISGKKRKGTTTFLSEEEKRSRHIASEKKRREAIRLAFDRIVELVPDLTPAESRTEVAVLTKSANFIDKLRAENEQLVQLLRLRGVMIPPNLMESFTNTRGGKGEDSSA